MSGVLNLHLILKRKYVTNRFLAKENGTRPAIDPMFRSAARCYGRRVIGVLLTGNLDDGTAGSGLIKDEGGLAVVQDPNDALYSVEADYIVPLAEMAPLLVSLIGEDVKEKMSMEEREEEEEELELVMTRPGCGGVMREFKDKKTLWYQCMVGHRFSSETMMLEQNRVIEEQLFRTLAFLKEKEEAMRTMASDARASINSPVDPEYFEKQGEAAVKVQERIKNILDEFGASLFPGTPSKELNS